MDDEEEGSVALTVLKWLGGLIAAAFVGVIVSIVGWTANKILTHDTDITEMKAEHRGINYRHERLDKYVDKLEVHYDKKVEQLESHFKAVGRSAPVESQKAPNKEK